jgi:hypothetical protein
MLIIEQKITRQQIPYITGHNTPGMIQIFEFFDIPINCHHAKFPRIYKTWVLWPVISSKIINTCWNIFSFIDLFIQHRNKINHISFGQ